MQVGLAFAFLGGVLGVFSPCNALLLPAFFAHLAPSARNLWAQGMMFLAGLLATLVPLGLGLGWLGGRLAIDRGLLLVAAGWIIMGLGLVQLLGGGFDLSRLMPRGRGPARKPGSFTATFLLGAVSGIAGFCTGPVLGAILTLVLTSSNPWQGGVLLGIYGIGMVIPLLAVAAAIRKYGFLKWKWLRGRQFTVGRLRLHTIPLATGAVTMLVGAVMLWTNGLAAAPELLPGGTVSFLSGVGTGIDRLVPAWAWTSLAALGLFAWWLRAAVKRTRAVPEPVVGPSPEPTGRKVR